MNTFFFRVRISGQKLLVHAMVCWLWQVLEPGSVVYQSVPGYQNNAFSGYVGRLCK